MLTFTDEDYEALRNETGIIPCKLKMQLSSEDSLHSFNVTQLKAIIRYVKTKTHVHINVSGRKDQLIENLGNVLFSPGSYNYPFPSAATSSTASSPPANVTLEHNTHITSPLSVYLSPLPLTDVLFNDVHFNERQSPFFEQKKQLLVFSFPKHESTFQRKSFLVDNTIQEALITKSGFIHVRFFNKDRGCDIPWNVDVKLSINSHETDLSKLARKIRSKPFSNPFVLPRPADISAHIRASNLLEFVHPGECGILVVQFVRERPMEEIIAAVRTETAKSVVAVTKSTSADGIEEVNYMLSLRCPLSFMRIIEPSKSKYCSHAQCFDLKAYLEYSCQQQLWQCPVCTQRCPYKDLIIDPKFSLILNSVTSEDMQVIVGPDGSFEVPSPQADKTKRSGAFSPETFHKQNSVYDSPLLSPSSLNNTPLLVNSNPLTTSTTTSVTVNSISGLSLSADSVTLPGAAVLLREVEETSPYSLKYINSSITTIDNDTKDLTFSATLDLVLPQQQHIPPLVSSLSSAPNFSQLDDCIIISDED
jgi:hypothetical protein